MILSKRHTCTRTEGQFNDSGWERVVHDSISEIGENLADVMFELPNADHCWRIEVHSWPWSSSRLQRKENKALHTIRLKSIRAPEHVHCQNVGPTRKGLRTCIRRKGQFYGPVYSVDMPQFIQSSGRKARL